MGSFWTSESMVTMGLLAMAIGPRTMRDQHDSQVAMASYHGEMPQALGALLGRLQGPILGSRTPRDA